MMQKDAKTLARLSRSVLARLPATLNDAKLVTQICSVGAAWLLADPTRVRPDAAGRLRLGPEISPMLTQLGRSVSWMVDEHHHHGQQATEEAAKTLRGLRSGRLDMDRLLQHAARFRVLRRSHIRRNAIDKVHAKADAISLDDGAFRATRVTSERELNRLGQQAGNCLASPPHLRHYADRLRRKKTAFWRIDPIDAPWMGDYHPIWVVARSTRTGAVQEFQHVGSSISIPNDRDVLLKFLAVLQGRGTSCSELGALARYVIAPPLVEAAVAGTLQRFRTKLADTAWRFEVAPGVLTAIVEGEFVDFGGSQVAALMLQGLTTGAETILSTSSSWANDIENLQDLRRLESAATYARSLAIRLALRSACTRSSRLRRACAEVFCNESREFLSDWFGL